MELSSNDYKRLSKRIKQNPNSINDADLEALQCLRVSYKEDLASLFAILIKVVRKVDKRSIITYRIKRIESIISKLLRQPTMQVNKMADIAGCRCIVSSDEVVWKTFEAIKPYVNIVGTPNDYITSPKPDGYRSLHLNVTIGDSNKTMEIQIRSVDEHNWATLVEITDLVYSSKIKEKGEGELAEFHRLLSRNTEELCTEDKMRILSIAEKHNYFVKISSIFSKNYIDVRKSYNDAKISGAKFFLLATGDDGTPEIKPFKDFDAAEQEYYNRFRNNHGNKNIVLTHTSTASFDEISMAYSNYFLTYNALFFKCYQMLSSIVVDYYDSRHYVKFYKTYRMFLNFTRHLFSVQLKDYVELQKSRIVLKSTKKRKGWMESIRLHLNTIVSIFNQTHAEMNKKKSFISNITQSYLYYKFKNKAIDLLE